LEELAMRIMITGGAGFVGAHMVEHMLRTTDWDIVVLDRLDCSGNLNRLASLECWSSESRRVHFFYHDLKAPISDWMAKQIGEVDHIIHLASGSHVDRSIEDPLLFAHDNTVGAVNIMQFARTSMRGRMIQFGTDEVMGPARNEEAFKEWDRLNPTNPYSASKAGAEAFAHAFANTYKLPVISTRSMNIFGRFQHPEKFIPLCINAALTGSKVLIHADPTRTKPGTRQYIHARNVSAAVLWLLEYGNCLDGSGKQGIYHVVGTRDVDNLELARTIAGIVGKPLNYELVDFHSSRPGHDVAYRLDGSLLKSTGFEYPVTFEESLRKTVEWALKNRGWL
jgi:dTDP-glucose 4,6-dehydratase